MANLSPCCVKKQLLRLFKMRSRKEGEESSENTFLLGSFFILFLCMLSGTCISWAKLQLVLALRTCLKALLKWKPLHGLNRL